MPERNRRLMQPDEVRDFVNDVIAAGYEINALGHNPPAHVERDRISREPLLSSLTWSER